MHREIIRVNKPYRILEHLHRFSPGKKPIPCVIDGDTFRRLIPIHGEYLPVMAIIHEKDGYIEVMWHGDDEFRGDISRIMGHILSVDVNYSHFLQTLEDYPALLKIAKKYEGLRPARNLNVYETLIKVVIQQRIAMRVALNITAKLVETYGTTSNADTIKYYSFPPAEILSKISVDKMRELGLTGMKAKSIVEIAKMEENGELPSLDDVEKNPEECRETLLSIYGVGRWTVELTFATLRHDFSIGPAGDLNVMKGFKRFGLRNENEIRRFLSRFGEWKGLLMYILALNVEG